MSRLAPSPAILLRRERLSVMLERGTPGEQAVAAEKLGRLDARYDFSSAASPAEPDLFGGWVPKRSDKSSAVLSVENSWMDVGNLIKWVFENRFQLSAKWSYSGAGADLMLQGWLGTLARTQAFTAGLFATIQESCLAFFGQGKTAGLDRAPFLTGFYDGLMNENHPAGTLVPGRSPIATKSKKGRSTPRKKAKTGSAARTCRAVEPTHVAAVHPYDLGREAGRKLRLEVPREEICEGIRLAVAGPRAGDETEQAAN